MHITCSCYNRLEELPVHVIETRKGEKGGQKKRNCNRGKISGRQFSSKQLHLIEGAHEANTCYHSVPTTVTFYKSAHCSRSRATCTHTHTHTDAQAWLTVALISMCTSAHSCCAILLSLSPGSLLCCVVLCSPELIPLMENCTSMLREKLQQQQPQEKKGNGTRRSEASQR